MARGDDQAKAAEVSANKFSGGLQSNTGQLYSTLAPQLSVDSLHPTGFTPQMEADMNTASQQSVGGSNAGAVGQGNLLAARTKNAGGPDAAIAESVREGGRQASKNALGIKIASAQLAQQKRAQALGQMGDLYGTSTTGANSALGQVASNSQADTAAKNASWNWASQILVPMMGAAGRAAGSFPRK